MGCTTSASATTWARPSENRTLNDSEEDGAEDYSLLDSLHGVEIIMRRRSEQKLQQNIVTENRNKDIHEFYALDYETELGSGVSGTVCMGVHRNSNAQYAIKVLTKKKVKLEKLKQLQQEIRIMVNLDHPNILRLHECFETRDVIYLVLELCKGGELLNRLHAQEDSKFPEKIACQYVYTILSAVRYCHAHNIVHRDLKLENFLFESTTADSDLKLIDFGLSQYFDSSSRMLSKSCGTPYYVAPEVLEGSYNCKCDVWSVGVIAYMLLSGSPPFYGKNDAETLQAVRSGRWRFNDNQFRLISTSAKSFIKQCLERSVQKRPSADEAISNPWFQKLLFADAIPMVLGFDIIQRMSKFQRRSSLAKLFLEVVAHTLTPDQIVSLRREYIKLDTTRSGVISIQDLRSVFDGQSGPHKKDSPSLSDLEIAQIFDSVDYDHSGNEPPLTLIVTPFHNPLDVTPPQSQCILRLHLFSRVSRGNSQPIRDNAGKPETGL